jgi:hypothetical protein
VASAKTNLRIDGSHMIYRKRFDLMLRIGNHVQRFASRTQNPFENSTSHTGSLGINAQDANDFYLSELIHTKHQKNIKMFIVSSVLKNAIRQ